MIPIFRPIDKINHITTEIKSYHGAVAIRYSMVPYNKENSTKDIILDLISTNLNNYIVTNENRTEYVITEYEYISITIEIDKNTQLYIDFEYIDKDISEEKKQKYTRTINNILELFSTNFILKFDSEF